MASGGIWTAGIYGHWGSMDSEEARVVVGLGAMGKYPQQGAMGVRTLGNKGVRKEGIRGRVKWVGNKMAVGKNRLRKT